MIPIQFELGLDWKVLNYLKLRFNSTLWEGATTLTNAGSDLRLKNAADLNLGFDIQLNKKWALWFDLNNIANMKYQRWSQYTSYGFNFVGGIRFCFLKM